MVDPGHGRWLLVVVAGVALACGGGDDADGAGGGSSSEGAEDPESGFETRDGSEMSPGAEELGTLQPVTTGEASPTVTAGAPPPAGRLIAEPHERGPAVVLQGRTLVDAGLRIEGVPPGVAVHRAGLNPATWELVRGARRIALIQQVPWSQAAGAGLSRTADARRQADIDDWGGGRARIVLEQLSDERHVYRIERLANGTDFIQRGWRWRQDEGVTPDR